MQVKDIIKSMNLDHQENEFIFYNQDSYGFYCTGVAIKNHKCVFECDIDALGEERLTTGELLKMMTIFKEDAPIVVELSQGKLVEGPFELEQVNHECDFYMIGF